MSDEIGPDGLTDEERERFFENRRRGLAMDQRNGLFISELIDGLAAERLAHAETRAERDRLRAAGIEVDRECLIGKLWSHEAREAVNTLRTLLGEVKP